MFTTLGRIVLRHKFIVMAVWILAAVWMVTQAPVLKDVAISETSEFLPRSAPSIMAQTAIAKAFPAEANLATAILVFSRRGSLTDADNAYAKTLLGWLASPAAPDPVEEVTSVFSREGAEALFLSPDRSTMLATVSFSSGPMDAKTMEAVKAIRQRIRANAPPSGLSVHVTGTSAISSDQRTALFEGVDRTTAVTIALVIIVLLLIYRSPVAATAPLVTISLAWLVARGLLGYLATAGWRISSYVDTFIIVLIFGVGTDYCLFILSRFREELGRQSTRDEAITVTMSAIGAVITASAGTVIVALIFMVTGEFIMLQTMGPAMALAVGITLLAGLTLTPALVAIMGRYLFWPRHDEVMTSGGRTWQRIAEIATSRYRLVTPIVIIALLIPYLAIPQLNQMFDVLAELPDETDSVQGFEKLKQGFDAGELLPVTVLLTAPQGSILDQLDKVHQFATLLEATPEVQRVRSLLEPTGDPQAAAALRVDGQLRLAAEALTPLISSLDEPGKMSQSSGAHAGSMADLRAYLDDLAKLSSIADQAAYRDAVTRAQAVDAGLTRLNEATRLVTQLEGLSKQMAQMAQALATATTGSAGSSGSITGDVQTLAVYLKQMGQAFPQLAAAPSYGEAVGALQDLTDALTKLQDALRVTSQLTLLGKQLEDLSNALANPLTALTLMGGGQSTQQLALLASYYADLGKAFPTIAATPAYTSLVQRLNRLDSAVKRMISQPPTDLVGALADLKKEVDGLVADNAALRQAFAAQAPSAVFVPQNMQVLAAAQAAGAALPNPTPSAEKLAASLSSLARIAQAQLPTATFIPKDIPLNEEMKRALATLKQDLLALQDALNRLATAISAKTIFFLPRSLERDARFTSLVSYFVSEDRQSTRLTVVLKARPYSVQANRDVRALRKTVEAAGSAVGLRTALGGTPVILNDVQETLSRDFVRIGIYTILGVFVVLLLLLRTVVAPIYLVLTVLLSYGSTMGLSTIVFQDVLGHEGINYVIPIVVFVLLVALGADYNIFLMSRVREEAEGWGTRAGIRVASAFTGSIITSCGIILAGTFAAMMVAPIQTLFQVGFAVALGVLVDTFIIRAVLVPAIAAALGERNWWPGRVKTP